MASLVKRMVCRRTSILQREICAIKLQCYRILSSKVPEAPCWEYVESAHLPEDIDLGLVQQLERVSLVELDNEAGLQLLRDTVRSANRLQQMATEGVQPLTSVLEDRELWTRRDAVTEGNCVQEILQNASVVEEQYFVAPPGNIPLKTKNKDHLSNLLSPTPSATKES